MHKLLLVMLVVVLACLSCSSEADTTDRNNARDRMVKHPVHTDHSSFFQEPFTDGPAVTRACLQCHKDSAHEVMQTAHWNWELAR